jgi:hypothetical protein
MLFGARELFPCDTDQASLRGQSPPTFTLPFSAFKNIKGK